MDEPEIPFHTGNPSKEDIQRVEEAFVKLCQQEKVKWRTNKYFIYQSVYFSGAIMMCNFTTPHWTVCLMSRRNIVNKY